MKKKIIEIAFLTALVGFISFLLLKDPFIGLADNGDYSRVIQPLGFVADGHERYYSAYNFFTIKNMDANDVSGSISKIIDPGLPNNQEYYSTQSILVKASMIVNYLIKVALGKSPDVFNIKILGLLYGIMYSYGFYLFLKNIKIKSPVFRGVFLVCALIALCDIGYLIYFNSFFGESTVIAAFMLTAGSCLALIRSEKWSGSIYYGVLFYASGILLAGAKVANTPIGILIGIFSAALFVLKKAKSTKAVIVIGSAAIVAFSFYYYAGAPVWMNQVNNYQSLFFGVLKDSPTPEQDLKEMGISEKYLPLANTHGYQDHGEFDIYSDEFQKEVYDKSSFPQILKFYIVHPQRFLDKLILSAENSVEIRPSYLGNFEAGAGMERLSFTNRFSLWSHLRTDALGKAFPIVFIYSVLYFVTNTAELVSAIRKRNELKTTFCFAGILLFLVTMSQFVLPIIGNGEADLPKHMLLFNLGFDFMMLTGIVWLVQISNVKFVLKLIPVAGAALLFLFCITPHQQIVSDPLFQPGDYVQFGTYKSEPLVWIVLNHDKSNGYLLWCDKELEYQEFDKTDEANPGAEYGSNSWETSDVRAWLNDSFIKTFDENDQNLINKVKLKNVLNYNEIGSREGGDKPHYWTAVTPYVDQNYDRDAYYNYSEDEIFLLDCSQLKKFVFDNRLGFKKYDYTGSKNEKTRYWLRTPYYNSTSMARIVDKNGLVYHKDANTKAGIIPAFYLDDTAAVKEGTGRGNDPYIIKTKE